MQLAEITAITGMSGLYKIASRRNDGLIVTSLTDNKTQFVSGRTHLFSTLDNITMYTTDEPVALRDVLISIRQHLDKTPLPDTKDDAATRAWFEVVLPTYDKEKVYLSDIKKLAKWYSILLNANIIDELLTEPTEEGAISEATEDAPAKEEKKVKAAKTDKPKKEAKPKVVKDAGNKAATKPSGAVKKVSAPRKAQ
jgi:hypothetical protein